MGWETFSQGLKVYFKKFAWSNTTLQDFISSLQEGYDLNNPDSKFDLNDWAKQWLQTKGPNTITIEFDQDNGKITAFRIKQGYTKYGDHIYRR